MRDASVAAATTASIALLTLGALGAMTASGQAHGDHLMALPSDLKWADVPSLPSGAKISVIEGPMNEVRPFMLRLKLPARYQIPAHSHTAIEHVTVISGTFNLGMGDKLDPKATRALGPDSIADHAARQQAPRSQEQQAPRSPAGARGLDATRANLQRARKLVTEAEQACKVGNMSLSSEKAKAALEALK
jgi:hypothetical protein